MRSLLKILLICLAFARYDAVALGSAVGAVMALGLFLATAVLLVRDGDSAGRTLSLLANYVPGFRVSWGGAFLSLAEVAPAGFAFGYLLAKAINTVVGWHEKALLRRIQFSSAWPPETRLTSRPRVSNTMTVGMLPTSNWPARPALGP